MATFEDAVIAQKKMLAGKQDMIQWWPGFMGDGAGIVNTASDQMCLVRYPFANSPAVPVLDLTGVARVDGLAVKVGYLPWSPGNLQIISVDDQRLNPSNPADVPTAPGTTTGYVPNSAPHEINHGFLGVDPVYIDISQVMNLSVQPSSGMTVQVFPGTLPNAYVTSQTVDLSSSVPVSGARFALISYNKTTGAVVVTDGAINSAGFSALTQADIPATPAGTWRSAAIVLYPGQTEIQRSRTENDFWDVRFPEESTAGAVAPGDITLTDAHIIVGNASNIGADVAMSNDATMANTGALTIANNAVTYAKMQNVTATQRALGRNTAGSGDPEEVTATQLIDWIGSTRGSILYRGASGWAILTPGTSGNVLTSNGAGADPSYQTIIPGAVNVYNETASGDGSTTTFYLANVAVPSTIRVYIDGIRQAASDDTDPTDTVIFSPAPFNGASLLFDYELYIA